MPRNFSLHCGRVGLAVVGLGLFSACSKSPAPTVESAPLVRHEPPPAALLSALHGWRIEGPKGWAFTQSTSGEGRDRVERYDPRRRGAERWTLLEENGRAPTEEEQRRYRDSRPLFDAAANLAGQLNADRADLVAEDADGFTYEFRLRPVDENDKAAEHMRARFTQDRDSGAIIRVELFNHRPFKPARSLTIHEARTVVSYDPPAEGRPALPREVVMRVRGERFWFRDFSQEIVSVYRDFEPAFRDGEKALRNPMENGVDKDGPG